MNVVDQFLSAAAEKSWQIFCAARDGKLEKLKELTKSLKEASMKRALKTHRIDVVNAMFPIPEKDLYRNTPPKIVKSTELDNPSSFFGGYITPRKPDAVLKELLNPSTIRWNAGLAASFGGHTDAVKELIENGANLLLRNNIGFSASMLAAHEGHADTLEVIMDHLAERAIKDENDVFSPDLGIATDKVVKDLREAAKQAAKQGHMDALVVILSGLDRHFCHVDWNGICNEIRKCAKDTQILGLVQNPLRLKESISAYKALKTLKADVVDKPDTNLARQPV